MNTMTDVKNLVATNGKVRMTPSEAFVETLVAQGVKDTFGIVGSAYMDAHDLFPLAGIRFISVAHEQNIFDAVPSSTCVSSPRTGSNSATAWSNAMVSWVAVIAPEPPR